MNLFETNIMTLQHSDNSVVARHLPVQVDTVNLPWNMEVQSTIPTDWFDLFSLGWISPVPVRSDYFVDETTGTKYQVFSVTAQYTDHLEVRCTRYSSSVTP